MNRAEPTPEDRLKTNPTGDAETFIEKFQFEPLAADKLDVMQALSNDETPSTKVVEICHRDPVIAARIIGLANGPHYAVRSPVERVHDAVVRVLGLDTTRAVVLGMILSSNLPSPSCLGFSKDQFWIESVHRAELAQLVASHADPSGALNARAYLGGLLRSLGVFALAAFEPRIVESLIAEQALDAFEERLTQAFGFEPAGLTAVILERWGVPDVVRKAASPFSSSIAARCVSLAETWRNAGDETCEAMQQAQQDLADYGYTASLEQLVSEREEQLERARAIASGISR
ncbi:MAG: HDOD domain-containing protein [Pseudomonadota bacterium]